MNLKNYLNSIGQTQTFFAKKLGVTKQTICGYCNGGRIPNKFVKEKIEQITDGLVKANEWGTNEPSTT